MDLFNTFGTFVGLFSALFSLLAWLKARRIQKDQQAEKARQSKSITVTLQYGGKKIELPVELRRAELTRAEVLGRLGMIPMKNKANRFALSYLNTPEFFKQVHQIMDANDHGVLTIPCNKEEFEQFDLPQ